MNTRVLELGADDFAQSFLDFAVDPDIFYTVFSHDITSFFTTIPDIAAKRNSPRLCTDLTDNYLGTSTMI